jgi:hypothetical protein
MSWRRKFFLAAVLLPAALWRLFSYHTWEFAGIGTTTSFPPSPTYVPLTLQRARMPYFGAL